MKLKKYYLNYIKNLSKEELNTHIMDMYSWGLGKEETKQVKQVWLKYARNPGQTFNEPSLQKRARQLQLEIDTIKGNMHSLGGYDQQADNYYCEITEQTMLKTEYGKIYGSPHKRTTSKRRTYRRKNRQQQIPNPTQKSENLTLQFPL